MTPGPRQAPAGGVRRGGVRTPAGYLFELTGGRLCLDFVNTVDDRPRRPRELLAAPQDLVDWAEQTGALARSEAAALRREAARHPRRAMAGLRRARRLREAMHAVFSSVAAGRGIPDEPLEAINAALPGALRLRRLTADRDGCIWTWRTPRGLDAILAAVIASAADLLTSRDLRRLRECAADPCGWIFLDTSRNRTRRWCDMSVCGNRAKARRHYRRRRAQRA